MSHDLVLCAAALGAGLLNAIAGGGTFLTFPALVLAGLPPVAANATSAVAVFPGYLGGALGLQSEIRATGRSLLLAALGVSLVGGVAGSALLILTPEQTFRSIVPLLLLFSTVLFAFGSGARRGDGQPSMHARRWRLPALLATGVYGGYFNGGLGILLMAVLSTWGLASLRSVNGLKNAVSFLLSGLSVVIFAIAGLVHWREALLMMVFALAGGWCGARLARVLPDGVVRGLVVVVGLVMTVVFFNH